MREGGIQSLSPNPCHAGPAGSYHPMIVVWVSSKGLRSTTQPLHAYSSQSHACQHAFHPMRPCAVDQIRSAPLGHPNTLTLQSLTRGFSPLTGFMNKEDYESVVADLRLKV